MIRALPDTRVFRRIAGPALATALLCSLSACASGNNAVTAQFRAPGDGVATVVGSIRVLNAIVVGPEQGPGAAVISMTLANDSVTPETIATVRTDRFGVATLAGSRVVPAKSTLTFGAGTAQGSATLPAFNGRAGEAVAIDVEFERSAPVKRLQTVIAPATGYYAGFTVAPTGSATPAPSAGTPQLSPSAPAGSGGAQPSADAAVPQAPQQS